MALEERVDASLLERFAGLGDAVSAVSDVLDSLGFAGAIAASRLTPRVSGSMLAGRALTLRNVASTEPVAAVIASGESRMNAMEVHRRARPGDVLVIQGVSGASNLGGISAAYGRSRGEVGAVVEGGVRDVGSFAETGYPVWSSEVTPISGKWRVDTVSVNEPIEICGVRVSPGDLVVADDSGVCVVPAAMAAFVLERAEAARAEEREVLERIGARMGKARRAEG